ncbi:hypothetical protein ACIQNV_37200 [Streptomyces hydrogenans]|uniref:hypothetical protein n=1 Tax=Streptomyces hydrogenans TaxID=1873719 RepID=UPI0037F8D110
MSTTNKVNSIAMPSPAPRAGTLTTAHVLGVTAFPGLATLLTVNDVPADEIYPLLGISGAIGVGVVLAASGGRRVLAAFATVLRAGQ